MRPLWIALVAGIFAVLCWPQSPDAGTKSLDPLVADPAHYHLEFQNQWEAPNIAHQDENILGTRTVMFRIELNQTR